MSNANAWGALPWRRSLPQGRRVTALVVVSALSMMTACASGPLPVVASYPAPPASMTRVEPLPSPQPESGRPEDLLANHVQWANALHRSRANHEHLIRWLNAVMRVDVRLDER